MPTTRSATRSQTKLDDFADRDHPQAQTLTRNYVNRDKDLASSVVKTHTKRKQAKNQAVASSPPMKRVKKNQQQQQPKTQQHLSAENIGQLENPITINRAPVLQLWSALVAQFLYTDLPWAACLSVGNAISALCAVSKGRAIGLMEPKDAEEPNKKKEREPRGEGGDREIFVMGFHLRLENEAVLLSGKPKPLSENTLKAKFGHEAYEAAKRAMSDSLDNTWTNQSTQLNEKAFHMYEKFRPNVATGQQGWGRKGQLNLHEVASIIRCEND